MGEAMHFAVAPTGAALCDSLRSHGSRRGLFASVPAGTSECRVTTWGNK